MKVQYVLHLLPCRLVLYVATLAVGKAEEQGVFEEFATYLAVVHSTRGSPVLTDFLGRRR
jgi:hypothetical protein